MKKLLYFLKIVLIQDIFFNLTFLPLQECRYDIYNNNEALVFLIDVLKGFVYSLGISGLLFLVNAVWVVLLKKKLEVYLMITLSSGFYVFVFFEYVLQISGAFRELLLPTIFGVYGGISLVLYEEKIKNIFLKRRKS